MAEEFEVKAAAMIDKYSGDKMGITQIKYLTTVLTLCKKMNNEFKFNMPDKKLSIDWSVHDWCDYLDLSWQEGRKKDDIK